MSTGKPRIPSYLLPILVCVALWSLYKGLILKIQFFGLYFWVTTYKYGFVRRGLAGTILGPIFENRSLEESHRLVIIIYYSALFIFLAILFSVCLSVMKKKKTDFFYLFLLFLSSPVLLHLSFNTGFPDTLILCSACVIWICTLQKRYILAAFLIIPGTLIHEMLVLLVFPLLILAVYLNESEVRTRNIRIIHLSALFFIVSIIICFCTQKPSPLLKQEYIQFGMTEEFTDSILTTQLSQGLFYSLKNMILNLWLRYPCNALIAIIYVLLPSLIVFGDMMRTIRNNISENHEKKVLTALFVFSSFIPALSLLIAWDLSRLLCFVSVSCFLSVCTVLFVRETWTFSISKKRKAVYWSIAVLYLFLPLFYLYFDKGCIISYELFLYSPQWIIDLFLKVIQFYRH